MDVSVQSGVSLEQSLAHRQRVVEVLATVRQVAEVSLVKRGANRRRFLLYKSDEGGGLDFSDQGLAAMEADINRPAPDEGEALEEVAAAYNDWGWDFDESDRVRAMSLLRLGSIEGTPQERGAVIAQAMGVGETIQKGVSMRPFPQYPDVTRCAVCGMAADTGDTFCRRCGVELRPDAVAMDSGDTPPGICRECGGAYDEGDAYCPTCGTQISEMVQMNKADPGTTGSRRLLIDADAHDPASLVAVFKEASERGLPKGGARALMSALLDSGASIGDIEKAMEANPEFYRQYDAEVTRGVPDLWEEDKQYQAAAEAQRVTKSAEGPAWRELERVAKSMVAKGNGSLTKEQAIVKAAEMYPDLYVRYMKETSF